MVALPVWIESWVCQCCGILRRVGENVDLALTFAGDVAATDEPDRIDIRPDGQVVLVGSVTGSVDDELNDRSVPLVRTGNVEIALSGDAPAARVRCTGKLWEVRHGFAAGMTRGRLFAIHWRPAEADGRPAELTSTDDWPRDTSDDWSLELTVWVRP